MTRVGFEPTQHYVMRNPLSAGKPKLESHALTARPSCLMLSYRIDGNKCIVFTIYVSETKNPRKKQRYLQTTLSQVLLH
jgi:hypothetical protein